MRNIWKSAVGENMQNKLSQFKENIRIGLCIMISIMACPFYLSWRLVKKICSGKLEINKAELKENIRIVLCITLAILILPFYVVVEVIDRFGDWIEKRLSVYIWIR